MQSDVYKKKKKSALTKPAKQRWILKVGFTFDLRRSAPDANNKRITYLFKKSQFPLHTDKANNTMLL